MFSGEECTVTIRCENSLAGAVIDRFGTGVSIFAGRDGHFDFSVPVIVSNNFYSWVLQFGNKVQIVSPNHVKRKMGELISSVEDFYK